MLTDTVVKAVVYKGHTLGLLHEGAESYTIEVLNEMVTKGAPFRVHADPIII